MVIMEELIIITTYYLITIAIVYWSYKGFVKRLSSSNEIYKKIKKARMTKDDFERLRLNFHSFSTPFDKIMLRFHLSRKIIRFMYMMLLSALIISISIMFLFYIQIITFIMLLLIISSILVMILEKKRFTEHHYDVFFALIVLCFFLFVIFIAIVMVYLILYSTFGPGSWIINTSFEITITEPGWYRDLATISFSFSIGLIIVVSLIHYLQQKEIVEKSCVDNLTDSIIQSDKASYIDYVKDEENFLNNLFKDYSNVQEISLILKRFAQSIIIFIVFGILFLILDALVFFGYTSFTLSNTNENPLEHTSIDLLILALFVFVIILNVGGLIWKFVHICSTTLIRFKEPKS